MKSLTGFYSLKTNKSHWYFAFNDVNGNFPIGGHQPMKITHPEETNRSVILLWDFELPEELLV